LINISPSSAIRNSTPVIGRPTVPSLYSFGVFMVMIGDVSLRP